MESTCFWKKPFLLWKISFNSALFTSEDFFLKVTVARPAQSDRLDAAFLSIISSLEESVGKVLSELSEIVF